MSEVKIHPTAIVHPGARLGKGTSVGAFSVIDDGAVLGENCVVKENVIIRSGVRTGNNVQFFPFCVIGEAPQHLKYNGEPTYVTLGNDVILREKVTIHRGTSFGLGDTQIADKAYLMADAHVAHDCIVGPGAIIANAVLLAGHVEVGGGTFLGGGVAVAQFCRVGRLCYVGGKTAIRKDMPPFLLGKGAELEIQGVNLIGLQRHGLDADRVSAMKKLYRMFFMQNLTVSNAIEKINVELGSTPEVDEFIQFVKTSKMGLTR